MDNELLQQWLFLAAGTVGTWRPIAFAILIGIVLVSVVVALSVYFPSDEW